MVLCSTFSAADGTAKPFVIKVLKVNEYQKDAHLHSCHVRNIDTELRVMVLISFLFNSNVEHVERGE